MTRAGVAVVVLLMAGACGGGVEVDPAALPSIANYTTWHSQTVVGFAPGHGDTVRVIYQNPVIRAYPHAGRYAIGSVLVKEIRASNAGQPGDLLYRAIMRKVGDDPSVAVPVNAGWVFTEQRGAGPEVQKDACWSCHMSGPYDGAFFDHGE